MACDPVHSLPLPPLPGVSRGPSPVVLGSQDALPVATAFTEYVHACFRGPSPRYPSATPVQRGWARVCRVACDDMMGWQGLRGSRVDANAGVKGAPLERGWVSAS